MNCRRRWSLVVAPLLVVVSTVLPANLLAQEPYEVPKGWSGKVVLAELFTGSECPPCVAADVAFDELMKHYPTTVLAVLEYHLHVPRPDPITNTHTVERGSYYGRLGTPTVFVDGKETGRGGGSIDRARALFNVYSSAIDRGLKATPPVEIRLSVQRSGKIIDVTAFAEPGEGIDKFKDLRLRIAVAEKQVVYAGSNGIQLHQLAVRHMVGGPQGFPFDPSQGAITKSARIDIGEIEVGLLEYLNQFEERNARPGRWAGFTQKMEMIDPESLVVVAFVQEDAGKRVLQAIVIEPD
jgi:thiol-disulfide isomerase/thioredoxin